MWNLFVSILNIFLLLNVFDALMGVKSDETATKLEFAKYAYTRSSRVENKLKQLQNSCGTKTECFNVDAIDKQNCILKCISRKCYDEIYASNPLEEGEIDQRYTSFKGCFASDAEL